MNPISFPEQSYVIAGNQPEYTPLPAHFDRKEGIVTFCWQLTWRERLLLLLGGKLWHRVYTFGHSLQPQLLLTEKPRLGQRQKPA